MTIFVFDSSVYLRCDRNLNADYFHWLVSQWSGENDTNHFPVLQLLKIFAFGKRFVFPHLIKVHVFGWSFKTINWIIQIEKK